MIYERSINGMELKILAKAGSSCIRYTWRGGGGEKQKIIPYWKYQIQKDSWERYVTALRSPGLLPGQGGGKPPSNHDKVQWKVGEVVFILRLAGTCRPVRHLRWNHKSLLSVFITRLMKEIKK